MKIILSIALAIGLGFLGLVCGKGFSLSSQGLVFLVGLGFLDVHYQRVSLVVSTVVLFQTRGCIFTCA